MRIFLASLVIGLLALLAGNKADQESDRLSRQAINLPSADTPVPRAPSGAKQRVVDGSNIPLNPFAAPDSQKNAVLKDPEQQSQLESSRHWHQHALLAYRLAWIAPLAVLALFVMGRMTRQRMLQSEATDQSQKAALDPATVADESTKGGA